MRLGQQFHYCIVGADLPVFAGGGMARILPGGEHLFLRGAFAVPGVSDLDVPGCAARSQRRARGVS